MSLTNSSSAGFSAATRKYIFQENWLQQLPCLQIAASRNKAVRLEGLSIELYSLPFQSLPRSPGSWPYGIHLIQGHGWEEGLEETRAAAGCFNGMPQESFISNWLVTNQINIASNESSFELLEMLSIGVWGLSKVKCSFNHINMLITSKQ